MDTSENPACRSSRTRHWPTRRANGPASGCCRSATGRRRCCPFAPRAIAASASRRGTTPASVSAPGMTWSGAPTRWPRRADDDFLEFIAVLVPGGAFSEPLQAATRGRHDRASTRPATASSPSINWPPGKDLWLLASGTGLGPFLSILRDPAVWQNYERLIVVHSVRHSAELAWRDEIAGIPQRELFADARATLTYLPVVTREPGATRLVERIPLLLADGRLEAAAGRRSTSPRRACWSAAIPK